ncbi:MAG: hypothetical protein KF746_01060 [Chitinophagaceae bacterium]|nr:hypothetical protein [Chitinophagaceae bacterium]
MPDYHIPLLPGEKYHILSRAVGNEQLFLTEENYCFFLERYKKYVSPIADTYCYSLLPNHFHFLVKIKEEPAIFRLPDKQIPPEQLPAMIMLQFSKLLNSYAKAYNKANSRKGSLFIDFLRRGAIEKEEQFGATVFYIHKNPVHHGYCKAMEDWKWSSYNTMFSQKPTMLLRDEVLDWFGGLKSFTDYHAQPVYLKNAVDLE